MSVGAGTWAPRATAERRVRSHCAHPQALQVARGSLRVSSQRRASQHAGRHARHTCARKDLHQLTFVDGVRHVVIGWGRRHAGGRSRQRRGSKAGRKRVLKARRPVRRRQHISATSRQHVSSKLSKDGHLGHTMHGRRQVHAKRRRPGCNVRRRRRRRRWPQRHGVLAQGARWQHPAAMTMRARRQAVMPDVRKRGRERRLWQSGPRKKRHRQVRRLCKDAATVRCARRRLFRGRGAAPRRRHKLLLLPCDGLFTLAQQPVLQRHGLVQLSRCLLGLPRSFIGTCFRLVQRDF